MGKTGRPSKLTEKQWLEIASRLSMGEKTRALAKEFKVAESTIRERLSAQTAQVKSVANQILATESALKALPVSAQISAHNLADQLRAISGHLAGAANFGAATAHRLSGIANAKVMEIDDAAPLDSESLEALKGVSALTKIANDAAFIPMGLLAANKETIKEMNQTAKPVPSRVSVLIEDASMPDAEAK